MDQSIKSIFDEGASHLEINSALLKKIHTYVIAFMNRNSDHVEFFGGNLLGVYPVRFKSSDQAEWFDEILKIDDVVLGFKIRALPTLDPDWIRGTDVANLSCLWLVHRIYNSRLSESEKEQGMIDCLLVLHFKLIGSLMARFFKYPADKSVALATYAALSKKFMIKQAGSWYNLLLMRAKNIISPSEVHHKTIVNFDPDASIQYMITDIQGRLKNIVKKMRAVFEIVRNQDAKILTMKSTIQSDGEVVLRDLVRNFTPYRRYAYQILSDKTLFIKDEIVRVICSAMHRMRMEDLYKTLDYLTLNYQKKEESKEIEDFIDETILHLFDFLGNDRSIQNNTGNLATVITRLRAVYMSSRSTDPMLLKMRDLGENIVSKATNITSPAALAPVRTGLMLYICLRVLSMKHYG